MLDTCDSLSRLRIQATEIFAAEQLNPNAVKSLFDEGLSVQAVLDFCQGRAPDIRLACRIQSILCLGGLIGNSLATKIKLAVARRFDPSARPGDEYTQAEQIMQTVLEDCVDPKFRSLLDTHAEGKTSMHFRCAKGVRTLCQIDATGEELESLLMLKDQSGITPMHLVCSYQPKLLVSFRSKLTTDQCSRLLGIQDLKGQTPVHALAAQKPEELKRILAEENFSADQFFTLLTHSDSEGKTPLNIVYGKHLSSLSTSIYSLLTRHPLLFELFVMGLPSSEVYAWLGTWMQAHLAPFHAICRDMPHLVGPLLEQLDPRQRDALIWDDNGKKGTPMGVACEYQPRVAKILLDTVGRSMYLKLLNIKASGKTPFLIACEHQPKLVLHLIKRLHLDTLRTCALTIDSTTNWNAVAVACRYYPKLAIALISSLRLSLADLNQMRCKPMRIATQYAPAVIEFVLEGNKESQIDYFLRSLSQIDLSRMKAHLPEHYRVAMQPDRKMRRSDPENWSPPLFESAFIFDQLKALSKLHRRAPDLFWKHLRVFLSGSYRPDRRMNLLNRLLFPNPELSTRLSQLQSLPPEPEDIDLTELLDLTEKLDPKIANTLREFIRRIIEEEAFLGTPAKGSAELTQWYQRLRCLVKLIIAKLKELPEDEINQHKHLFIELASASTRCARAHMDEAQLIYDTLCGNYPSLSDKIHKTIEQLISSYIMDEIKPFLSKAAGYHIHAYNILAHPLGLRTDADPLEVSTLQKGKPFGFTKAAALKSIEQKLQADSICRAIMDEAKDGKGRLKYDDLLDWFKENVPVYFTASSDFDACLKALQPHRALMYGLGGSLFEAARAAWVYQKQLATYSKNSALLAKLTVETRQRIRMAASLPTDIRMALSDIDKPWSLEDCNAIRSMLAPPIPPQLPEPPRQDEEMDEEIQLGQLVDQLRNAQDPIASYAGRMEELIHVMEGFDIPYDPRHHATPDQHVRVERGMEYLQELTGNNPDQRLGPEAILQMLVEMRILAI